MKTFILYLILVIFISLKTIAGKSIKQMDFDADNAEKSLLTDENLKRKFFKSVLLDNLQESDFSEDYEVDDNLIDSHKNRPNNKLKRGFFSKHHDIQIYYDVVKLKNGFVMLVPKDVNKNHYFIG